MTRRRALLLGFDAAFAEAIKEHGIDTVCRIGVATPGEPYETIQHKDFAELRSPAAYDLVPRDGFRERMHARCFEAFARCVDRYAKTSRLVNDYTDYELLFDKALAQMASVLAIHQPDLVIAVNVPHRATTLAAFEYAREAGIETVVCLQSQFPDRLFIVDHWSDIGLFQSSRDGEACEIDHSVPDRMPFYMDRIDTPLQRKVRALLKYCEFGFRLLALPALTMARDGAYRANRELDEMRNAVQMVKQAQGRASVPQRIRSELAGDFVFFPLHMQPEMTTDILGGAWSNQVLALRRLRQIVPPEIPIVVKENPKQTGLMRSPQFWEHIAAIPNTAFVEDHASSLELIRAAMLTATISGTAGWEALRCGRPALAFGNVFWRSLPGAFHVDDNPQWESIRSFAFDAGRFTDAVQEMSRKTYRGVADPDYAVIVPGFDAAANQAELARSIAAHIQAGTQR